MNGGMLKKKKPSPYVAIAISGIWFERLTMSPVLIRGKYFSECTGMAQEVRKVECVGRSVCVWLVRCF